MPKSAPAAYKTAFDDSAPQAERTEALKALYKDYVPYSESGLMMPLSVLAEIVAEVKTDFMEMEMAKADVLFPSKSTGKRGMQSIDLDELHAAKQNGYRERPSLLTFAQMRQMVAQTPILEAIVLTRTRQIQRFCQVQESGQGMGFEIRHIDRDHELTKSEQESIKQLQRFIINCGWEFNPRERRKLKRDNFASFMAKSVRDSLIMDSAPIETEYKRNKKRGMDGFYAVDGETIRLTAEEGYENDPGIFALQVVQGRIATAYTLDDLIYEPRNPRTDVTLSGYGLSETELLIKIVTGILNALQLNLRGFSENAIPKGVLHLVGNYAQKDLHYFRRYWNAMVKGIDSSWALPLLESTDKESKASFEKFGVDFNEMYFSKWMTFLTAIACAVYGMSPDEINFESFNNGHSRLSGSDTSEKLSSSHDKGLLPLLSYYENLISDYIISDFNDQFVFRWTGLNDASEDKRHEIRKLTLTVNEARTQEGFKPLEGPLGDAPLNASLIGPWMQLKQQQEGNEEEDFGQREDDQRYEQEEQRMSSDRKNSRSPDENDETAIRHGESKKSDEETSEKNNEEEDFRLGKSMIRLGDYE